MVSVTVVRSTTCSRSLPRATLTECSDTAPKAPVATASCCTCSAVAGVTEATAATVAECTRSAARAGSRQKHLSVYPRGSRPTLAPDRLTQQPSDAALPPARARTPEPSPRFPAAPRASEGPEFSATFDNDAHYRNVARCPQEPPQRRPPSRTQARSRFLHGWDADVAKRRLLLPLWSLFQGHVSKPTGASGFPVKLLP